jgi:hypothetical protein
MTAFTELELAVLHSIFSETPALAPALEQQLAVASVTKHENSGGGFFTTIAIAGDPPKVVVSDVLGFDTQARVKGLEHGMGFVLFTKDGLICLLEGFSWGPESTAALDLQSLDFEIYKQAPLKLS